MITTFLCFSPPIASSKEKHNPTRILNLGYIHLYVFFTHWRFGALQQWLHALFETLFFHCLRFLLYIGLLTRKVLLFALHFLRLATRLLVRTSDGSEANQCFFFTTIPGLSSIDFNWVSIAHWTYCMSQFFGPIPITIWWSNHSSCWFSSKAYSTWFCMKDFLHRPDKDDRFRSARWHEDWPATSPSYHKVHKLNLRENWSEWVGWGRPKRLSNLL